MSYSAFHSTKLAKGLYLEERPGAAFIKARATLKGAISFFNTETTDHARAERLARSWFARLKSDDTPGAHSAVTMHDAAKTFIRDIRKPVRREYHQVKWNAISDFFKAVDVDAVDTPMLKKFSRWRHEVKPITLAKDFVTIRLILRHAVEEGWLTALPVFPRVGKLDTNPRPWLESHEWDTLQQTAERRIEDSEGEAGKHRHARRDLLDFMRLMVATCMRVDELRSIRVRDVQVKRKTTPALDVDTTTWKMSRSPAEYLEIEVNGKTGKRVTVTRPANSGVDQFRAIVARKSLTPDDLLFSEHHRDAFRELLIAAGLRTKNGNTRNFKSLRCTGIMLWVLADPNVNLKLLAQNVGTSVQMLDTFYLKPLNVQMRREELVG